MQHSGRCRRLGRQARNFFEIAGGGSRRSRRSRGACRRKGDREAAACRSSTNSPAKLSTKFNRFLISCAIPAVYCPHDVLFSVDVRVFNLIVLAQFVWRGSSAAIPARRPQVVAPPDRMPRPYRAVRRTRRDVRQRVSAPMGPMVYCRRNAAGARSSRSGAPLFPGNPKAGPSFPCAWAFGDRRWRGRRQVAIGPPGLFGLVRRDDLGA
jgi:hypothetical protein